MCYRTDLLVVCLEGTGFCRFHGLLEPMRVRCGLKLFYFLCEEYDAKSTLCPLAPFYFFFFLMTKLMRGRATEDPGNPGVSNGDDSTSS